MEKEGKNGRDAQIVKKSFFFPLFLSGHLDRYSVVSFTYSSTESLFPIFGEMFSSSFSTSLACRLSLFCVDASMIAYVHLSTFSSFLAIRSAFGCFAALYRKAKAKIAHILFHTSMKQGEGMNGWVCHIKSQ